MDFEFDCVVDFELGFVEEVECFADCSFDHVFEWENAEGVLVFFDLFKNVLD